jgi:hypothetical protein
MRHMLRSFLAGLILGSCAPPAKPRPVKLTVVEVEPVCIPVREIPNWMQKPIGIEPKHPRYTSLGPR